MSEESNSTKYQNVTSLEITLKALYEYILNSDEYLSLAGKTQVLNQGVEHPELDITTRMEHDRQVSVNAMKIAQILGMKTYGMQLSQIAGLAHDIGHTPFGHDGESILRKELKAFGEGYTFAHETYGTEVLERMIQRYYHLVKDGKIDTPKGFNKEYLILIKHELKQAVKNHSQYFGFKVEGETKVEKSVRLADTISFMVTDLADLLRGKVGETDEPIISQEELLEELHNIPGMSSELAQEVMPSIAILLHGDKKEIESLQEELINESFSRTRKGDAVCTIIDDIKLEQSIVSSIQEMQRRTESKTCKNKVINAITTYYGYLTDNYSKSEQNFEFQRMIETITHEQDPKECYIKLSEINKSLKEENDLTEEQERIVGYLVGDDSNHVLDIVRRHEEQLVARDLKLYPNLMTIFALQDSLHYEQILKQNPERLGNSAIPKQTENGRDVQSMRKAVESKFETVMKLAYAAYENPEEYTLNKKENNVLSYQGRRVPKYGRITYRPLLYAIYATQQMQNKDFEDDKIIDEIVEDLYIDPQKIEEIEKIDMQEIHEKATPLLPKRNATRVVTHGKSMALRNTKKEHNLGEKKSIIYHKLTKFSSADISRVMVDDFMSFNESMQNEFLNFINKEMDKTSSKEDKEQNQDGGEK